MTSVLVPGDAIFAIDYESGADVWEFAPDGAGGFSAALGMLAADAAGNVYYETVGEEPIGSIDSDVSADQASAGAICSVSLAQIAGGFSDGTFRPGDPVTRGQMSTFIDRSLQQGIIGE